MVVIMKSPGVRHEEESMRPLSNADPQCAARTGVPGEASRGRTCTRDSGGMREIAVVAEVHCGRKAHNAVEVDPQGGNDEAATEVVNFRLMGFGAGCRWQPGVAPLMIKA